MDVIKYFLRTDIDGYAFQKFSFIHISILVFAAISSFFILKKMKEKRFTELFIGYTLLLQQIGLYSWYLFNNYNVLKQGLPLYHCRVAILALSLGMILNKESLMRLGSFWGLMGSFFALLLPDPDPFLFPHITLVSFFVGHLFLLWGSIYTLWIKKLNIDRNSIKGILVFTNIYCISMYFLNIHLDSNYGYMRVSPVPLNADLSQSAYGLLALIVTNIIMLLMYAMNYRININKISNEYEEEMIDVEFENCITL